MEQITKIVVSNGEIKVYHSDKLIDKRTEYNIHFDSFYKGYIDYIVDKKRINNVIASPLESKLYVSTNKFNEDSGSWIDKVVSNYNERYGEHHWFREPELQNQIK